MVLGYLDTVPRIVEIGRADWVDARPLIDALEADASEWQEHFLRHRSRILVAMTVPAWVRLKEEETKTEARLAEAQIAFALTLHKVEHGEYPDSLDALAPDFLDQVPLDPFTSQPLEYARDGEGFLIYSVGLDGADDGGLTETEEAGKKVNPNTDDIAWRCTR